MSRASSPFNPRTVLGLLAVGAAAFLLFLYALGAGWTGGDRSSGSGHAASKALNGYAAFYQLLDKRGFDVSLSRSNSKLDSNSLLVLTPPHFVDGDALAKLIAKRRTEGPTLLILPKWFGIDASQISNIKGAKKGWVLLSDAASPDWVDKIGIKDLALAIGKAPRWHAEGKSGAMPTPDQVQTVLGPGLSGLVRTESGVDLVAYRDDGGYYKLLENWADRTPRDPAALAQAKPQAVKLEVVDETGQSDDESDYDPADDYWPLVIVADPDLVNNAGMANAERARVAVELVDATLDGYDLPIVFDLTLPGLGAHENLLTLAFEPPFLAATLTLLLAALVIGWRGFVRFGPARATRPGLAGGKAQLARDGATLVERARRLALVGPPYAALVARRLGRALGVPERSPPEARNAAIARALERRGEDRNAFAVASEALRQARRPAELLRAALAMNSLERTLRR